MDKRDEYAECDRLMLVANAAGSFDESHKPGSFGFHEALDRTYLVSEHWESFIMGHPSVFLDAELYREANTILTAVTNFYSKLGQKHL